MGILFLPILFISNSCNKSSDNNMTNGTSGTGGKGSPGTNEVFIQGMAFSPSIITVAVNTTVTWTNKDAITHTVTSDSGAFDSGNVVSGSTFSYTFATAGTFAYHCKIHPSMVATVVVSETAQMTPTTTPTTPSTTTTPGY